jgi:1,4-dihydroxy-2-naphthoyl-CoA hydrolase
MSEHSGPGDFIEAFKGLRSAYDSALGIEFDSITLERVEAHLDLDPARHTQPYGIVHGGVYCSIAETLASVGAAFNAMNDNRNAVGLENHTSFLRAVREGRVTAVATASYRGRTTHVWEVSITDPAGRPVARSTVRLALPERREP